MKQKRVAILVLSLLAVSGTVLAGACGGQAPTTTIKDITPAEAYYLMEKNKGDPDFVILDVRTPAEFSEGHIESAINIDFNSQDFRKAISRLNRNRTYLVYGQSGDRSGQALDVMKKLGFTQVYHIAAGITGWLEEDLPTVK